MAKNNKRLECELTTECWALKLVFSTARSDMVGLRTRTPEGKETTHWTHMPPAMARKVMKVVETHVAYKDKIAAMTPAQQAEYFQEVMGT